MDGSIMTILRNRLILNGSGWNMWRNIRGVWCPHIRGLTLDLSPEIYNEDERSWMEIWTPGTEITFGYADSITYFLLK